LEDELLGLRTLSVSAKPFQDPLVLAEENAYFKAYDMGLSEEVKLWFPEMTETSIKRDKFLRNYARVEGTKIH